jgi:hypothetical protein
MILVEDLRGDCESFIGGCGVCAKIIMERMKAGVTRLDGQHPRSETVSTLSE